MYGAYEEATRDHGRASAETAAPVPPRPAYGHSKDGRDDLKQGFLSLGGSRDGGLPLRGGVRDGNTSDSTETPVAIEACLALGLEGVRGIVAWIKNPAALTPVWLEQPERIAALVMLTVGGLLVYTLIQQQVRLYLQLSGQQVPGNKGLRPSPRRQWYYLCVFRS